MNRLSNEDYLKGIAENDYPTLNHIYQESLPAVIQYLKKNSGTVDDAKDVFQEAIVVIFNKVRANELVLTTSFHQYLFTVCRRMWLRKLKINKRKAVTSGAEKEFIYEEEYEEAFLKSRKWRLFNQKLGLLTQECQQVLKMAFNGRSTKEITQELGYTGAYAKRKRYKCRSSLSDLINKDPEYYQLKKADDYGS